MAAKETSMPRLITHLALGAVLLLAVSTACDASRATPPAADSTSPAGAESPVPDPSPVEAETGSDAAAFSHGRADATITLRRSTCTLDGSDDPIKTSTLRLEFFNDSSKSALFRIGRIDADRAWPGANPNRGFREVKIVFSSRQPHARSTWASRRGRATGTWGVICHADSIPDPCCFSPGYVDAVGPLVVG